MVAGFAGVVIDFFQYELIGSAIIALIEFVIIFVWLRNFAIERKRNGRGRGEYRSMGDQAQYPAAQALLLSAVL